MRKLFTITFLTFFLFGLSTAQIEIDGDLLDWAGIDPITQGDGAEPTGDVPVATYDDFDLANMYITHDTSYVYVRIDLAAAASFANFYNFTNEPVFEFYMDTEIGDTTGFDWGWWSTAMNYYVSFNLHPDSVTKSAELWHYYGARNPNGEFDWVTSVAVAVNGDNNAIEFAIPRDMVNFGTEFRPWMYSVGDFQWTDGADQMPQQGGAYMLKYDFWEGASVYMHNGPQIDSDITIDGDMIDWAAIAAVDVDEIAEETGDFSGGPEYDLQDIYVTSDSFNLYIKIDINTASTFADWYNDDNPPYFQVLFDVNWGDTTGLGWGGWFVYAADYVINFGDLLHPDSTDTETVLEQYIADYNGAFEDYAEVDGATVTFAKNDDDNSLEICVPRSGLNVDTDVRLYINLVGNEDWDNEEYFPTTAVQNDPPYYGFNWNFISGPSIVNPGDNSIISSIIDRKRTQIAKRFGLVSNYPNPFNPNTTIEFSLYRAAPVTVEIYNILGSKITTLLNNERMSAGEKHVAWDGTNSNGTPVVSGIYLYKVQSGNNSVVKKMVLVK